MKKTYTVAYGPTFWECQISIDPEVLIDWKDPKTEKQMTTMDCIKSMVEFWTGYKRRLNANDGDYIKTFLQQLAAEAILIAVSNNYNLTGIVSEFEDKEGWCKMDGSMGIEIIAADEFSFDDYEFEVTEDPS